MKKQHRGLFAATILAIFVSVCLVHAEEPEKLVEKPLKDLGRIPLDLYRRSAGAWSIC